MVGRWIGLFLLLALCNGAFAADAGRLNVGFHRLTVNDPLDSRPMRAIALYPTLAQPSPTPIGSFTLPLAQEAPAAPGRFPLLVISHGDYGTPLAHRDLLLSLVHQGFVVLALLHPGDNLHDHSRLGALSNLYGRPLQVTATISAALLDPNLASFVDAQRIGVIGYSAGGETALILAGARPSLERLRQYCHERPDDQDACSSKGELRADRLDLRPEADPRVGALLLLAPLGLKFGSRELANVHVPVLLYSGDNDHILDVGKNATALARKLPRPPVYRVLNGAGHFVFMTPCNADELEEIPHLCKDAEGVDRRVIHRNLNAEAAEFFKQGLAAAGTRMSAHKDSMQP